MNSYESILSCYEQWITEPLPANRGWKQRRGYAFERMLNALFTLEDLAPRTNYRPDGEEIDGSLIIDGRTYLMEAKWWKDKLPASQLYAFKGKIDGKLSGTLGIVISHSGFADDAIDALVSGKGINMVLFDATDVQTIFRGQSTFSQALRKKLRYAAEYGQPYTPIKPDTSDGFAPCSGDTGELGLERQTIDVVVEGPSDEEALRTLLQRSSPLLAPRVEIWKALGQLNLVDLAGDLARLGHKDITVFLDTDLTGTDRVTEIAESVQNIGAHLVKFTPSFIDLLELACDTDYYNSVPPTSIPAKHARRMARHANLDSLWTASPELRDWWNMKEGNSDGKSI